ncbi:putative nonribosomal peptide synthetase [Rhodocollybia butyracea]|uniref:Nonribosomal peptide synthetase n=1 Tax=Rhodocollybia butyracea TaxID=206335 RepID=A0A9P5PA23_9AGAR|nr:putative nonribosomal peptide synthetase [Rhodocollybia butyracea]
MSKTAVKPPFRHYTTVPQLLEFHYEHNPAQPVFVFADEDALTEITYLEYIRACHRVAHFVRPHRTGPDRAVVAVVALADNLIYDSISVGIIHAGLVPLLISPRLTPAAVVNLLRVSGAHRLLTTGTTLYELIHGITEKLASADPAYILSIEEVPTISQLYPKLGNEKIADQFEAFYPWDSSYPTPQETALYLHSSGSTGLPKCIPLSHWMLYCGFSNVLGAYYRYPTQLRVTGMMLPPFHLIGLYTQILCPLYASISVGLFPPSVTRPDALPIMATPDSTLTHSKRTRSNAMVAVPSLLQAFSQTSTGVDFLRLFESVTFAGGPLAPATGDYLVSCGVRLRAVYGGTEFGLPVILDLAGTGGFKDWEWLDLRDISYLRWVPQGDGTSELQLLTTETFKPAIENLDDVLGYATSDLFSPHPTKPGLWKIVGRGDDVITHSSGEKTVPLPMEHVLSCSSMVQGAIMFGRQRDQPGFLIEPAPEYQVDVSNEAQVSQFRNKIWSTIEEANQIAPTFSKVYKEMILVAAIGKPLPRAAKGTISRKAAYKEYEKEIDRIYEIVASNGGGFVTPPCTWEIRDVQDWISAQVLELCGNKVGVSDDVFDHGIDSLSATILRSRVSTVLRSSDNAMIRGVAQHISQAAVYNHPSVESLTRYIIGFMQPGKYLNESHQVLMEQMIETYSEGLGSISNSEGRTSGSAVVFLTGSTGNLGAQMLASLVSNRTVDKVYTFNRPSTYSSIIARHKERFDNKGLDVGLLSSKKLVFLEGEASQPNLGLSPNQYHERSLKLLESLTVIIHNAWRLDFNLSLSSFDSHICGTRNLINLGRSSRYASSLRFLFTSSVSAAQSWNSILKGPYPEKIESNPQFAVGGGYGESKYVAERILRNSGLHVSVLRIGQISGGKPNGAWAMSDWFPMMIKSSLKLRVLPDAYGVVSWSPMDAISDAILDVAFSKKDPPLVVNLVHPFPTSWNSVINTIREVMISAKNLDVNALPLVSLQEWTTALEAKAAHATNGERADEVPASKILGFFQLLCQGDEVVRKNGDMLGEMGGISPFITENACKLSARMRDLEPICLVDAEMWVKYWIRNGM